MTSVLTGLGLIEEDSDGVNENIELIVESCKACGREGRGVGKNGLGGDNKIYKSLLDKE